MNTEQRHSAVVRKGRLALLMLAVVFFFVSLAFGREYIGNKQVQREIQSLEAERARLEQQKDQTMKLIQELSSEYYLEREGRLKHGLAKSGETMVVVEDEENRVDHELALGEEVAVPVSYPMRWFYYIFDPVEFERLKGYEQNL